MIGLLVNIIYAAIAVVLAILIGAWGWFERTIQSVKADKKNIIKLIVVPLVYYFLFTRALGIYELLIQKNHVSFQEKDMTPRREVKAERYVRLQGKTYFLDRYRNSVSFLMDDDRPVLSLAYYIMTYSRRFSKYGEIVWDRHCALMIEKDNPEELDSYLEKVRWMTDEEKSQRVNRIKSQIKFNKKKQP